MAVGTSFQTCKFVLPVAPVSASNDDFTGALGDSSPITVDCIGYNSACVVWQFGAIGASADPVLMAVHESDDNSTYAVVSGADWIADTTSEPAGGDEDGKIFVTFMDLRKRKRYLRIDFKSGASNATVAAVLVILGDPDVAPDTATERGLSAQIIV